MSNQNFITRFCFVLFFLSVILLNSPDGFARSPRWDFEQADASDPVIDSVYTQRQFDQRERNSIVINLPGRKLMIQKDGVPIKSYPIAVGSRVHNTPMGGRKITRIVWNPWWYPPKDSEWAKEETDMPPGPKNPMGPVKIDVGDRIFIHGTNEEFTVGRPVTHGCIRLKNADAKELAYWLQKHYGADYNDAQFERDIVEKKENVTIAVNPPVPVNVIYQLVEISDGMLHVYSDIYLQYEERQRLIIKALIDEGYPKSKIRKKILDRELKKANNKDLKVKLSKILRSSKKVALEDHAKLTED